MLCPSEYSPFPWMRFANQEWGVRRRPGRNRDHPAVVDYLRTVMRGSPHDETAWCSAFVNWCVEQAGLTGTGRANARSWLDWGGSCLDQPHYGAVTILWRESRTSWKGHVGFCVGIDPGRIYLLGGNQTRSSQVTMSAYPRERILGHRWPLGYPAPSMPLPGA